ncbi:hypothetical protein ANAPH2_00393 [Anaplasma phagocytophilum]|nr:hypothetical protein ANAPH2_00393 [Anaplasma phagocytophilum]
MTGQCSGLNTTTNGKFSAFAQGVGLIENKNWPTGKTLDTSSRAIEGIPNGNAEAVAKDLTKLATEEKTMEWAF